MPKRSREALTNIRHRPDSRRHYPQNGHNATGLVQFRIIFKEEGESPQSFSNLCHHPGLQHLQSYALLMPATYSLADSNKKWAAGSRRLARLALAITVVLLGAIIFLIFRWPFSRTAVVSELEEESFSKVSVGAFHGTYFPHPGCVLEHVVFRHNQKPGTPPLVTVNTIRIEGTFSGLFRRHVARVVA